MAQGSLANCESLEFLKISPSACLTMAASACEVYPNECMGYVCGGSAPAKTGRATSAVPFQLARRSKEAVESYSSDSLGKMLDSDPWHIIGSFHSHTCHSSRYEIICEPSDYDLDGMRVGDLELIILVKRQRKRSICCWRTTSAGNISVALGKFQFLVKAFVKTGEKKGFRRVRMELA